MAFRLFCTRVGREKSFFFGGKTFWEMNGQQEKEEADDVRLLLSYLQGSLRGRPSSGPVVSTLATVFAELLDFQVQPRPDLPVNDTRKLWFSYLLRLGDLHRKEDADRLAQLHAIFQR